jgi:CRP-like cAMP-binding protein
VHEVNFAKDARSFTACVDTQPAWLLAFSSLSLTREPNRSPSHKPRTHEVRQLPEFVDTAVKDIDDRLRVLKDDAARLEAARAVLTRGATRRSTRNGRRRVAARSSSRRNGSATRRRPGKTRANQALEIIRQYPGSTIPEIAEAMKIQPNYLYRVLPGLASAGEVRREGQGWHPVGSTSSALATSERHVAPRRQAQVAKWTAKGPANGSTTRRSKSPRRVAPDGQPTRGTTRITVLAALEVNEALTAAQVAEKTGLGRATVSTTLSRLAKSGAAEKAERGYRRRARDANGGSSG